MQKIKFFTLAILAMLSVNLAWGTDYSNEPFAFTSSSLPSGLSTTGTFNSSYYKMSSGNTAKIMASNMFKSEILSSDNMSIVVGCGTFGTWSNPKTIKLTAQFMDKDNKELSKAEHTTAGLGGNVSYSTAFTLAKPEDPSKISYLLITFSNFNSTSGGTARLGTIKLTYSTAATAKYTVTFNAGSGTCGTSSSTESTAGAGVNLPVASPSSACGTDGWTFAGWATASQAETTTAPTLYAANSNYKPSSNCTLYAVYSKTESSGGGSTTESVTWSSRYSGTTDVEGVELTIGTNAKVTHNKGSNNNKCQYYDTGTGIRVYGGGNLVVTASGSDITAISLTFGSGDGTTNTITANTGTYSSGSWSGKAASVTFSVGGTSGHRRIAGISVTFSGGSTTTYNSNPSCATCSNLINITKGSPSHGSFTLAGAGTDICADEPVTVNLSNITADTHYHATAVTTSATTGGGTPSAITSGSATVSGITASTTINVTFAEDTKVVVTLLNNNNPVNAGGFDAQGKKEYYTGETLGALPTLTSTDACDATSVTFMGWTTEQITTKQSAAPSFVTPTTPVTGNMTLRAVWARAQ